MPGTATLLAIPALLILLSLSVGTMHVQPTWNGYGLVIQEIIGDPAPRFLPATDRLLLRHYIGVAPIDKLLAVLNVVFAHTMDWSRPEFTLYCLHFSGQAAALFLIFNIEAQRTGSRWTLVQGTWAVFWGMASQLAAYTCAVPIFAIIHLLSVANRSDKVDAARIDDPAKIQALVPGCLLGFLLPTLLLGIPFTSSEHQQIANAVWQFFPVWIYFFTQLFAFVLKRTSAGADANKSLIARQQQALTYTYKFAFVLAASSQWLVATVIIAAQLAPGIFPQGMAAHFTWSNVFLPTKFLTHEKFESGAQVVHDMFIYDQIFGAASALLWAVVYCVETGGVDVDLSRILGDIVLAGPGGALVNILRKRDDSLSKTKEGKSVKKSQ